MTLLTYPRWRHLVVDVKPDTFHYTWQDQFKALYVECSHYWEGDMFCIETPRAIYRFSDWHYEYTDQPVLGEKADLEWKGGNSLTYAYDLIGQPYWLIDPKTGYPRNFEAMIRIAMIKKYMKQNNL